MKRADAHEQLRTLDDDRFDLLYPLEIRELSSIHWTPVSVARKAVRFLVNKPGTRVLDIGCGPGKFCMVGALTTEGLFTGVEQRESLCKLARHTIRKAKLANVEILHSNVTEIDFSQFDAFYLFNPFEENLLVAGQIDEAVDLSESLYDQYTAYVCSQLAAAPLGTRLATYCGQHEDVPVGFRRKGALFNNALKLWEKVSYEPLQETWLDETATPGDLRMLLELAARRGN